MIRCVIFDLDGTLCDTLRDLGEAMNASLRAGGFPEHPIEAYNHMVGSGMLKLVQRALPPDAAQDPETVEAARQREMAYYAEHLLDNTCPYPGVAEAVRALKDAGLALYVVTNKPQPMAQTIADTLFPGCFDAVMGQRPGHGVKPDPWGIGEARRLGGFAREECLFIGDSDVDVMTAHNGGLVCVGVTWGFRGRAELERAGAEIVVDTAAELAAAAGVQL